MKPGKTVVVFATFLLMATPQAACDPAGPTLSGTISLGSGVKPTSFATLQIRVYPDPGGTFDPSAIPSNADSDAELPSVSFPYSYSLGDATGTTSDATWRVVTWLSHDASSVLPASGDVLCTAVGTIKGCGIAGGHCGTTSGVDCTLSTVVE